MRWLELVWISPLVIGLGCGGNVQTSNSGGSAGNTSGGGSGATGVGGSGGTTVTTISTTSITTSSTTTTMPMGGAGGGTACDQACTKAESCGLPAGQCGQFLNCGQPQGACVADCVNDPSIMCSDLIEALQSQSGPLFACVQGCQGGMGGAGGGAGGGSPMACNQCGQNNCQNAFIQCTQQSNFQECQGWYNCAQGCSDAACFNGCTQQFPGGAVIAQCACSSCANECSGVCSGGVGGAGGMGAGGAGMGGAGGGGMGNAQQCQQCGQQQCGTEVQQCFGAGFAACQAWLNCSQACQNKACIDACSAANPAGAPVGACICTKCSPGGCAYTCD